MRRFLGVAVCMALLSSLAIMRAMHQFPLAYVPPSLKITNVLFAMERPGIWDAGNLLVSFAGFSRSGSGVYIYSLPDAAIDRVRKGGVSYLAGLDGLTPKGVHARYQQWQSTPIEWALTTRTNEYVGEFQKTKGVASYFLSYAFGQNTLSSLPRGIVEEINNSISKPGSYFAGNNWQCKRPRDCSVLIIVSPEAKKAFVIFASD